MVWQDGLAAWFGAQSGSMVRQDGLAAWSGSMILVAWVAYGLVASGSMVSSLAAVW